MQRYGAHDPNLGNILEDVDLVTFGKEFQRMLDLATLRGLTLYAIYNRISGVAIQWYSESDELRKRPARGYTTFKDGLCINTEKHTLQGAIRAEIARMEAGV